jgi:hypothetical protein
MMRLGISVEGPTEREFVNRVLKPHLTEAGWNVVKAVSMDGGVSLRRFRTEIRLLAAQFECVTTFYDFYGFQDRNGRDINALELEMREAAGGLPNFIPYLQQHEFEALIFADPPTVAAEFQQANAVNAINAILNECGGAENINHGYDTCPSRRLKRLFTAYDKVRHGPPLANKIGLPRIREACPRFDQWLAKLEVGARPY